MARVSSPELVGRTEQLAVLEGALARAARGEAAAAFVVGESGVGKTRLVGELERRAAARGARVLRGDCVAFGAGDLPYAPIAGALRRLQRDVGEEGLDELVGTGRAALRPLLPGLRDDPLAGSDDRRGEELAQARLFAALRALLDRLCDEGLVVLVVEDLHWADRSTLEFLSSLLRGLGDERLLVVCTYRSDEHDRRHVLRPFIAEEERRPVVERVEVASLSPAELTAQVAGILGEQPDPGLMRRLHERCEGNPFFAEELLAASADAKGPLPATLHEVLSLRLERLPDDARRVVGVAAAGGRRVGHELLAAVAGLPDHELLESLRTAIAHQVLVQDADGYAFRHALLQEAAYADLLPGERTAVHLGLAEALAADPGLAEGTTGTAAAELAHHWAAAHRAPAALAAYVNAGLEAERANAFAEAARHFENALELWDGVADAEERAGVRRADVIARTAEDTHLAGNHGRAVALGREAIELIDALDDAARSSLVRERVGRYLWLSGDSDGALVLYREAVDRLPPDPPTPELARALAAYAQILMLRGRSQAAREMCDRAIAAARGTGARAVEGHALNTLGTTLGAQGDRDGAEPPLREAMRIARELGELDDIARAYINLGDLRDQRGQTEEAIELARAGVQFAEGVGLRSYALFMEAGIGWRLLRLGRLDEADAVVARVLAERPSGIDAIMAHAAAGEIALRRGDLDAAARHADASRAAVAGSSAAIWIANAAPSLIELELWRGDPDCAWQHAERALGAMTGEDYGFYTAPVYCVATRAAADRAARALALGDRDGARRAQRDAAQTLASLREMLGPGQLPGGPPAPEVSAREALSAAELTRANARPDPEAWAAAADRFAALGFVFELAYARWRQAEAIVLGGGDRARAKTVLREAAELAADSGAQPLAGEIAGFARRARLPLGDEAPAEEPAPDSDLDALGLTERERAVLELVAEGRTNREIGETLFMAEKTASVHVSRILAKLGVRSRVEAATAAHRLGVTPSGSSAPGDRGRG